MATPAPAQMYSWTDDKGNIHFSDKPPASGKAKVVEPASPDSASSRRVQSAPARGRAIAYRGDKPSRRMVLEEIALDLPYKSGERVRIGALYRGSSCSPDAQLYAQGSEGLKSEETFRREFQRRLESLGYAQPELAAERRRGMSAKVAELSVVAAIIDIDLKLCDQARPDYGARYGNGYGRQYARVKVDWKIYDVLRESLVYQTHTEGVFDRWTQAYRSRESRALDVEVTVRKALMDASEQLLADQSVADLLSARPEVYAPAEQHASKQADFDLGLSFGDASSTFQKSLRQLKASTVTVRTVSGHGSGFLISHDGYVLTNYHVVEHSPEVVVVFDAEEIEGSVARYDADRDVALIKLVRVPAVEPLRITRRGIETGETVYVIGTPLKESLSHTVTRGIISASRRMKGMKHYQTDAVVNPGNSGGPAFDEHGEVVALAVSGLFTRDGGGMGINYLIPIDDGLRALGVRME